jgi:hypothetical protein
MHRFLQKKKDLFSLAHFFFEKRSLNPTSSLAKQEKPQTSPREGMCCVASKLEEEEEVVSICRERKRPLKLTLSSLSFDKNLNFHRERERERNAGWPVSHPCPSGGR